MTRQTARILIVSLRTSGPDSRKHSLLDIGAAWYSGGPVDEGLSIECSMFEGAEYCAAAAEHTGITRQRATDHYSPIEHEALRELVQWSGADEQPIILAGLRPGFTRSFLLAAARRAMPFPKNQKLPRFHGHVLDINSLFYQVKLLAGEAVPSCGYHISEIFSTYGLPNSSHQLPAIDSARRERDLLRAILES